MWPWIPITKLLIYYYNLACIHIKISQNNCRIQCRMMYIMSKTDFTVIY